MVNTKMVYLRDIIEGGWALYSSGKEMRDTWEYGGVKRRRQSKTFKVLED